MHLDYFFFAAMLASFFLKNMHVLRECELVIGTQFSNLYTPVEAA
jgi:hypothetical protein